MLTKDPKQRINSSEAIKHPFLQEKSKDDELLEDEKDDIGEEGSNLNEQNLKKMKE